MNPSEYLRQTKELIRSIQTRFLELGARLYHIKDQGLWKVEYESYPEFLESENVSTSMDSILRSIHKNYIIDGHVDVKQLEGAGYSNLYESIPLIEKEGIESAVVKAQTLTRSEIKDEVREIEHGRHLCTPSEALFSFCSVCKRLCRISEPLETDGTLKSNLEGFTVKE